MSLVLASRSPQRRAILERLGLRFEVRPSGAEELQRGDPRELALENASRKARAVARPGEVVIGADTVVSLGGVIFGQPADERHARETLRALSGAWHEVIGGVALVLADGERRTALAVTRVSFRELNEELLRWYVALGEWRGRAGGYAIQGAGAALVKAIEGEYENVVGLPLAALLDTYPALLSHRDTGGSAPERGGAPRGSP
jgi:septum formation protein